MEIKKNNFSKKVGDKIEMTKLSIKKIKEFMKKSINFVILDYITLNKSIKRMRQIKHLQINMKLFY